MPSVPAPQPLDLASTDSRGPGDPGDVLSPRSPDFREPGSAPRWRVGVGAVVVAALVFAGVAVVLSAVASAGEAVTPLPATGEATSSGAGVASRAMPSVSAGTEGGVFVHVLGRVDRPGLYEVAPGSRAVDVIAAAGGYAAEADESALNLARAVSDGEQIVVPAVGDPVATPPAPTAPQGATPGQPSGARVDLNTADQAALESIRGVGPATAGAILAWRDEHGRFVAVEDLLDVTGIGEKKLDAMRDSVVVR